MNRRWLQLTVTTDRTELAEAVFENREAQAVTVLDEGAEMAVEHEPNAQPAFDNARVVGLFDPESDGEAIIADLQGTLGRDVPVDSEMLEDRNWAGAWLAQHPPLRFGDRLWIAPHEAAVESGAHDIVVRLDPGLAFGTGTHPTTALCLEWLAAHPIRGCRVIDYGCGSGILAIAAAKLGAREVVAVDTDPQATRATRENAARNKVGALIQTPGIEAIDSAPYDIVLANILAKPLISLAPTLISLTAPGAPLVMAGLLSRHIDEIQRVYAPSFAFVEPAIREDWARLCGYRHVH